MRIVRLPPHETCEALKRWFAWTRSHEEVDSSVSLVRTSSASFVRITVGTIVEEEASSLLGADLTDSDPLLDALDTANAVCRVVRLGDPDDADVGRLLEIVGPTESMLLRLIEFSTATRTSEYRCEMRIVGYPSPTVSRLSLHEHIESAIDAMKASSAPSRVDPIPSSIPTFGALP